MINTAAEAAALVRAVGHPNFKLLVDHYHMAQEKEDPSIITKIAAHVRHVQIANPNDRKFPMDPGESDYASFFRVIKQGGYDKLCSAECSGLDPAKNGAKVLAFLKDAWARA